jgi:lysophospholipase L1-like esterase
MKPHHIVFLALLAIGCAARIESPAPDPFPDPANSAQLPLVLFVGNSLTKGDTASRPEMTYPAQTMHDLSTTTPWQNLGHNSETTAQMSGEVTALVDAQYDAKAPPIVVVWEGTNDLFTGASAPDAYQHLADYCAARRAIGFRVVLLSILPLVNAAVPDFNARRDTTNALLRAHWTEFADGFADVGGIPELQDPLSALFMPDHTHLRDEGYGLVAGAVAPELIKISTSR